MALFEIDEGESSGLPLGAAAQPVRKILDPDRPLPVRGSASTLSHAEAAINYNIVSKGGPHKPRARRVCGIEFEAGSLFVTSIRQAGPPTTCSPIADTEIEESIKRCLARARRPMKSC